MAEGYKWLGLRLEAVDYDMVAFLAATAGCSKRAVIAGLIRKEFVARMRGAASGEPEKQETAE